MAKTLSSSNPESRIELKEMPTKELLERFLSSLVLGQEVEVLFDVEEGKFIDMRQDAERCNPQ